MTVPQGIAARVVEPRPWDAGVFTVSRRTVPVTTSGSAGSMEMGMVILMCAVAWAIPGAGHLWLRRPWKGAIFLVA
ncbi:MAG TPA: DUF6677 family protein, partial [Dehalococcoidia bacterium]|nr:DUF6677 family protein [Dehalococcoidia bacterium]